MGGYSWLGDILALRYLWLWDIWFLGGVLAIEAHLALGWGICGCGTFDFGGIWLWDICLWRCLW